MLATLVTAVINGLRGELMRVEIDVAPGLPVCHIVGLPDAALSEARERVRGAIRNSGFEYPLERGLLPGAACLGLGNHVSATPATIKVHDGVVAVLVSHED